MDTVINLLITLFIVIIGTLLISIPILLIYLGVLKIFNADTPFSDLFKATLKSKKKLFLIGAIGFSFLIFISFLFLLNTNAKIEQPNSTDKLVKGKFGYNIPDTMKVGNRYRAVVTITKSLNDSILFLNLDSSNFNKEEIKVSTKMKVVLIEPDDKDNFSITPLNSEEQLVDDSSNTIWLWSITPLKSGKNELLLRATIKVITDLGETPRDIPLFEKIITVQASPIKTFLQFVSENWQWIAGTILIPLLLWLVAKIKNKKKKTVKVTGFGRNSESSK